MGVVCQDVFELTTDLLSGYFNTLMLITKTEINTAVDRLAVELATIDHPVLLAVLRGSTLFASDLIRGMTALGSSPVLEFYDPHVGYFSVQPNQLQRANYEGQLVVVDTIVTTGKTLQQLSERLDRHLSACVLLWPWYKRRRDGTCWHGEGAGFSVQYAGLQPVWPESAWVEGYGLDPARGLDYIRRATRS